MKEEWIMEPTGLGWPGKQTKLMVFQRIALEYMVPGVRMITAPYCTNARGVHDVTVW